MAFPAGWPPRPPSGRRSIRVFVSGTTTANFDDNAVLFSGISGANTFVPLPYVAPGGEKTVVNLDNGPLGGGANPHDASGGASAPMIWCNTIKIMNDGANPLQISFDGTNIHGVILPGEKLDFRERMESGIAVRGAAGATTFRIFGW